MVKENSKFETLLDKFWAVIVLTSFRRQWNDEK